MKLTIDAQALFPQFHEVKYRSWHRKILPTHDLGHAQVLAAHWYTTQSLQAWSDEQAIWAYNAFDTVIGRVLCAISRWQWKIRSGYGMVKRDHAIIGDQKVVRESGTARHLCLEQASGVASSANSI